jgi:hypothetical protein
MWHGKVVATGVATAVLGLGVLAPFANRHSHGVRGATSTGTSRKYCLPLEAIGAERAGEPVMIAARR